MAKGRNPVGRRIGKYRVKRVLGQGGMGTVLLAHQEDLKRDVALKVIKWRTKAASNEELFARFRREIRTCINFAHPHVVRIYDCEWESSSPYLVMEYVEGRTLRARVKAEGPFDGERIASVGLQTLDALAYIHERGVIHRDLKPANLMIRDDGMVKLMDFGLIKFEDQSGFATKQGQVVGSLRYLPPEAIVKESFDHRSDLYQLGAVLHFLALGRSIYREEKKAASLIRAIVDPETRPRSILAEREDFPQDLADFIEHLMAHDLADRFPDASAAARVLDRIAGKRGYGTRLSRSLPTIDLRDVPPRSDPVPPSSPAGGDEPIRPRRRRRGRRRFGFLIALAAVALVMVVVATLNPPPAPAPAIADFRVISGAKGVRIRWRSDLPCVGRLFAEREDGGVIRKIEGPETPGLHHEFWLSLVPETVWNVRAGARGHAYGLPTRVSLRPLEISGLKWDWLGPRRLGLRFRSSVPARSLLELHRPEGAKLPLVSTQTIDHVAAVTLPGDWGRPAGQIVCSSIDDVSFQVDTPADLRMPSAIVSDLAAALDRIDLNDLALRVQGELRAKRGIVRARALVDDAFRAAGIESLLELVERHGSSLFAGGWLTVVDRDRLYRLLCRLEDVDSFFYREHMASPYRLDRFFETYVRNLRPSVPPEDARLVKALGYRKVGMLLPRGVESARVMDMIGTLQGTKRVHRIAFSFDIAPEDWKALQRSPSLRFYCVGFHVFPSLVFELTFNYERTLFLRDSERSGKVDLVLAESSRGKPSSRELREGGTCLGASFPRSWLQPGRNECVITSRRVAGYQGQPATVLSQFLLAPGLP